MANPYTRGRNKARKDLIEEIGTSQVDFATDVGIDTAALFKAIDLFETAVTAVALGHKSSQPADTAPSS